MEQNFFIVFENSRDNYNLNLLLTNNKLVVFWYFNQYWYMHSVEIENKSDILTGQYMGMWSVFDHGLEQVRPCKTTAGRVNHLINFVYHVDDECERFVRCLHLDEYLFLMELFRRAAEIHGNFFTVSYIERID